MLAKLLLVVLPLISTATTFSVEAAAVEKRAEDGEVLPNDFVLFDIKANSRPPKYLSCTKDNIGDREAAAY